MDLDCTRRLQRCGSLETIDRQVVHAPVAAQEWPDTTAPAPSGRRRPRLVRDNFGRSRPGRKRKSAGLCQLAQHARGLAGRFVERRAIRLHAIAALSSGRHRPAAAGDAQRAGCRSRCPAGHATNRLGAPVHSTGLLDDTWWHRTYSKRPPYSTASSQPTDGCTCRPKTVAWSVGETTINRA